MGLLSQSHTVQSDIVDLLATINRHLWGMMKTVMALSVDSGTAPSLTLNHIRQMDRLRCHVDIALERSLEAYHSRSDCHLWDFEVLHNVLDMLDDSDLEDLFPTERWYKILNRDLSSLYGMGQEEVRRLQADEAPF